MKKAQYTPGPWIAVGYQVEVLNDNIPDICNTNPETFGQHGRSNIERRANARLIAAAPDLLAALQEVTMVLDRIFGVVGREPDAESISGRAKKPPPNCAACTPKTPAFKLDTTPPRLQIESLQARLEECRKLEPVVQRQLDIGKAIERACQELPEGAEIQIYLERGAGTVHMTDWEGNDFDHFDEDHDDFACRINAATDGAIAAEQVAAHVKQGGAAS